MTIRPKKKERSSLLINQTMQRLTTRRTKIQRMHGLLWLSQDISTCSTLEIMKMISWISTSSLITSSMTKMRTPSLCTNLLTEGTSTMFLLMEYNGMKKVFLIMKTGDQHSTVNTSFGIKRLKVQLDSSIGNLLSMERIMAGETENSKSKPQDAQEAALNLLIQMVLETVMELHTIGVTVQNGQMVNVQEKVKTSLFQETLMSDTIALVNNQYAGNSLFRVHSLSLMELIVN